MFCPNCGANNADTATMCVQCNQAIPQFSSSPQPPQPLQPSPAGMPVPAQPGHATPAQPQVQIPNYQTQSIVMIVASVLCCGNLLSLALAIVALVNSNQVKSKLAMGDVAGAQAAAKNAKMFNWISLGILVAIILIGIVLGALGVLQGIMQNS